LDSTYEAENADSQERFWLGDCGRDEGPEPDGEQKAGDRKNGDKGDRFSIERTTKQMPHDERLYHNKHQVVQNRSQFKDCCRSRIRMKKL